MENVRMVKLHSLCYIQSTYLGIIVDSSLFIIHYIQPIYIAGWFYFLNVF